jgi:hypothetical protein
MMPDISMCTGEGCPRKRWCYRYEAKASGPRQSWFSEPPVKDGECEHFMKIREKNNAHR